MTRLLPAQPNAVARQALDVLKQSRLQEQQQQRVAQARYLQQAVPPFRPIPGAEGGAPLVGVAVMAGPGGPQVSMRNRWLWPAVWRRSNTHAEYES